MNTIGQIGNFIVEKDKITFNYKGTCQSFTSSLNDFNNLWRRTLIKELQKVGKEYPDPVFTEKGRKILSAQIKVQCTDGNVENELCIHKINFPDRSMGYYDMFLV